MCAVNMAVQDTRCLDLANGNLKKKMIIFGSCYIYLHQLKLIMYKQISHITCTYHSSTPIIVCFSYERGVGDFLFVLATDTINKNIGVKVSCSNVT